MITQKVAGVDEVSLADLIATLSSDPDLLSNLATATHDTVAAKYGPLGWSKMDIESQMAYTWHVASPRLKLDPYDPLARAVAEWLVGAGHMDPIVKVGAAPQPDKVLVPVLQRPDADFDDDAVTLGKTWPAAQPGEAPVTQSWGTRYVAIPASILKAIGENRGERGRVGIRHVRLLAAITMHTHNGKGGRALVTIGQLARKSGWAPQSIRDAISKDSPLAPWAVKIGITKQGRTVFQVYSIGKSEQWVRIPWWWLWDEMTGATSRPINDRALLAALTLQRAVKVKNVNKCGGGVPSMRIDSYGTKGLGTLAGVDERTIKEGLRECYALGWVSTSVVKPTLGSGAAREEFAKAWGKGGGRGRWPVRTVVLHRP